MLFVQM